MTVQTKSRRRCATAIAAASTAKRAFCFENRRGKQTAYLVLQQLCKMLLPTLGINDTLRRVLQCCLAHGLEKKLE